MLVVVRRWQISEGRSGSFFYFSHDGRFMVKTIVSEERDALCRMLPAYLKHIRNNPDTLLCRLLGLYTLQDTVKGESYHFVTMASVFDTDLRIHERFDLKVSVCGRCVVAVWSLCGRCVVRASPCRLPGARVAGRV